MSSNRRVRFKFYGIDVFHAPPARGAREWRLWHCRGKRSDGRKCQRVLAEVEYPPASGFRIKCRDCGHFNEMTPNDPPTTPATWTPGAWGSRLPEGLNEATDRCTLDEVE